MNTPALENDSAGRSHAQSAASGSGLCALSPTYCGLVLVGDVHGHYQVLARLVAALPRTLAVVQVGDLGPLAAWVPLERPVYFVRGNHDDVPALRGLAAPTAVRPGLVYLRAGVHALGRMRVGVLGGAESLDGLARAGRRLVAGRGGSAAHGV